MIVSARTLSQSDTAVVLRERLGRLRAWPSFLSDGIRNRQHVCGHQLLPCCYQQGVSGFQPRYSLHDIAVFVHAVLRDEPRAGRKPMQPTTLRIDTARPWEQNKFDRLGTPVAMHVAPNCRGAAAGIAYAFA
jgi:hypothetical protein